MVLQAVHGRRLDGRRHLQQLRRGRGQPLLVLALVGRDGRPVALLPEHTALAVEGRKQAEVRAHDQRHLPRRQRRLGRRRLEGVGQLDAEHLRGRCRLVVRMGRPACAHRGPHEEGRGLHGLRTLPAQLLQALPAFLRGLAAVFALALARTAALAVLAVRGLAVADLAGRGEEQRVRRQAGQHRELTHVAAPLLLPLPLPRLAVRLVRFLFGGPTLSRAGRGDQAGAAFDGLERHGREAQRVELAVAVEVAVGHGRLQRQRQQRSAVRQAEHPQAVGEVVDGHVVRRPLPAVPLPLPVGRGRGRAVAAAARGRGAARKEAAGEQLALLLPAAGAVLLALAGRGRGLLLLLLLLRPVGTGAGGEAGGRARVFSLEVAEAEAMVAAVGPVVRQLLQQRVAEGRPVGQLLRRRAGD